MSLHLQNEIEVLNRKLRSLCTLVERNVASAVTAVEQRDTELSDRVIAADGEVDKCEIEVEEDCLKILALYQPVAVDLRFIVSVLKLNSDLERIGDLAVNIAERAQALAKKPEIGSIEFDFHTMFKFARTMLRQSLESLLRLDVPLAYEVLASDDQLDEMNRQVYALVANEVERNPQSIEIMIHYLTISRALERIGDHATNIAEDVIYMTEAKIVRHKTENWKE